MQASDHMSHVCIYICKPVIVFLTGVGAASHRAVKGFVFAAGSGSLTGASSDIISFDEVEIEDEGNDDVLDNVVNV